MVTFKSKVTYLSILYGLWVNLIDNRSTQVVVGIVIVLVELVNLYFQDYLALILAPILMLSIYLLGGALYRYLMVKTYHKADFVEYFFSDKEFGIAVANRKALLPKEDMKSIKITDKSVNIYMKKGTLHFLLVDNDPKEIRQKLESSEYKDLVQS